MPNCHDVTEMWELRNLGPTFVVSGVTGIYVLLMSVGFLFGEHSCVRCTGIATIAKDADGKAEFFAEHKGRGLVIFILHCLLLAAWIVIFVAEPSRFGCTLTFASFVPYYVAFVVFVVYLFMRWLLRIGTYCIFRDRFKEAEENSFFDVIYRLQPLGAAPARATYGSNERSVDLPLVSIPPLVKIGV